MTLRVIVLITCKLSFCISRLNARSSADNETDIDLKRAKVAVLLEIHFTNVHFNIIISQNIYKSKRTSNSLLINRVYFYISVFIYITCIISLCEYII